MRLLFSLSSLSSLALHLRFWSSSLMANWAVVLQLQWRSSLPWQCLVVHRP